MRRVGILGGMGPQATILIMQKVLAAVRAVDDADHIPLIVDQNPQVPSRIKHLVERTGSDPAPVLADSARRLVAGGADALAMPCNTAHHYAPAIRAAVDVPFLDMIELSADRAAKLTAVGGKVGILASPAVQDVGLFDRPFNRRGLTPIFPDCEAAKRMLSAIQLIKADGANSAAREVLRAVSSELALGGASIQMIACTEFSLIADAASGATAVFDTLDCLVEEIVRFSGVGPGWEPRGRS